MKCCAWSMHCNSTKKTVKSVRQAGAKARPAWVLPRKGWPNTWRPTPKSCNQSTLIYSKSHLHGGFLFVPNPYKAAKIRRTVILKGAHHADLVRHSLSAV